jgi:hypothetical protein
MNENQKKTTDDYRSGYDRIFRKEKTQGDAGLGVSEVHKELAEEVRTDKKDERGQ